MQINVRVMPRAKLNKIAVEKDGGLKVWTTAAPADGDANTAVIKLLSAHFDTAKSNIKIIRGATSRDKVVEVSE